MFRGCGGVRDGDDARSSSRHSVNPRPSGDDELGMTRLLPAPRDLVFSVTVAALCVLGLVVGLPPASAATSTTTTVPSTATAKTASSASGSGSGGAAKRSNGTQVNVLTATREEVTQKIAKLDEQYAAQGQAVDAANAAVDAAQQAVEQAKARVALAQNEVELGRQTVRAYAVEAYITPPAQNSLRVLSLGEADDASYANDVMRILADERHKVVDALVVKQKIVDQESAAADAAAQTAADQAASAQTQLDELDGIRSEQESLAASLDDRLDKALAEAAALAETDRQMAAELAAQETALRQSAGPATLKVQPVVAASQAAAPSGSTPPSSAGSGASSPTTTRAATTGPSATTPTPTPTPKPTPTPPAPPSSGIVTWADVTSVGGIYVNKSIASQVGALLNAATAAGFSLRGGGYRDSASQIATRQANCGTTYYDIYQKPASQCIPPTAIPGRSMHEQGRAIDFTSGGVLISSRSNPAFVWLSQNASRFGLYNLPSEPWHWSTNGN